MSEREAEKIGDSRRKGGIETNQDRKIQLLCDGRQTLGRARETQRHVRRPVQRVRRGPSGAAKGIGGAFT